MTGTPLDLTPFGPLLKGVGLLYWIAALACVGLALWWLERWWLKLGAVAVIAAAFVAPVLRYAQEQKAEHDVAKARLDAASAHFEMRCKSAGEVIHRTVPNVDGIVLLKVPPKHDSSRKADPLYPEAARFGEPTDDWYIRSMLRWPRTSRASSAADTATYPVGYEFVEVVDASTSIRYQHRIVRRPIAPGSRDYTLDLARDVATRPRPRYGVTYDDVFDAADRAHWIAGDVFRVIDLETNEVIGERKRFLWDPGLGGTAGSRQPWPWAGANGKRCPDERGGLDLITPTFIHRVLIPTKEE